MCTAGGGYFDRLLTQSFVESCSVPAIDYHTTPALAPQFNDAARTGTREGPARVYGYEGLNGAFLLDWFLTLVRGMLGPSQVVQARRVAPQDVCEDSHGHSAFRATCDTIPARSVSCVCDCAQMLMLSGDWVPKATSSYIPDVAIAPR